MRDCKEGAGFWEVTTDNGLHNLRKNMQLLANCAELESELEEVKLTEIYHCPMPHGFLSWCKKHLNHDVVVRDEYGYDHDKCHERVKCKTCGRYSHCKLKINHDGPCIGEKD